MAHDQLWAPWRLSYIKSDGEADQPESRPLDFPEGADPECFLCRAAALRSDRQNLVVARKEGVITVLNRYPYNNGHVLVAPVAHKGRLDDLDKSEQLGCLAEVTRLVEMIERLMNADGFNVGLNLGRTAGAGLPGHLHWHIVPRWNGDTNFMPVLAGVKVIPQSLESLWELLADSSVEHDQDAR